MRTIARLIIHCSATPQGVSLSFEECRRDLPPHETLPLLRGGKGVS